MRKSILPQNWSNISVTSGSHKDARLPVALAQSSARLRPGDLADSLARLADRAGAPWDAMLAREPAVVAAQILAFHLEDELQRFDISQEKGIVFASREIQVLAGRLADWLMRIDTQLSTAFSEVLQTLDDQMALRDRVTSLAAASHARIAGVVRGHAYLRRDYSDALSRAQAERDGLRAAHRQMVHAIAALKPAARLAFDARLKAGHIEPAIGLILAELAAAGVVDARLNRFTTRHTDFYYGDIIGQGLRGATPERALLHLPAGPKPKFIPAGTGLIARQADGKKLRFRTETDVPLSPARISATAAMTYDTDRQTSLFTTLGAITGVRAGIDSADSQPLNRGIFSAPATPDVDMGLDVASEMFALSEGQRRIDVTFAMRRATDLPAASSPGGPLTGSAPAPDIALELRADPALIYALGFDSLNAGIAVLTETVHARAIALDCTPSMDLIYQVIAEKTLTVAPLRLLLGRIVTLALVENHPLPTGAYWEALETRIIASEAALTGQRAHVATGPTDDAGQIVEVFARQNGQFIYSPADIFAKMLGDAFKVTMSGAERPLQPGFTQVLPIPATEPDRRSGLMLRLFFGPHMPPITTPDAVRGQAPVLALRWDQQSRVCPVSFFERYALDHIEISLKVDGLSHFAGFSDDGAIAPAQAFHPFGARPTEGASFTVAAPEMARKPVTRAWLDLLWADLPGQPGGFKTYYESYPKNFARPAPVVRVDYLSGDGWKPVQETPVRMIDADPHDQTLRQPRHLGGPVIGGGVPAAGPVPDKLPRSRAQLRGGALRLTMTGAGDFGRAAYPLALVDAMRPRLVPIRPRKVPPPPYIPKLDRLQFGYEATTTLTLAAAASARSGDRVMQVTPFGARQIFPHHVQRNLGLFPPRLGLGTLYLQLTGPGVLRQLGILFDIADSGHLRLVPPPVPLDWHYLSENGWVGLPSTAILSDTTDGLLKSGVVMLDLPDDAATPDGEMPAGGVWLAVSTTDRGLANMPILTHVRTNGVWAVSTAAHDPSGDHGRDWRFEVASPGLSPPIEVSRRAPPHHPETRPHYLARVSERLRHRQRAVTPYDMERLVIEAFPEVWRAKCLPHLTRTTAHPQPGAATLVVVRHPPPTGPHTPPGQERLFDVGTLNRIADDIQRHAPDGARVEVVNPAFDRLHVRAAVTFAPFRDDGAMANMLQRHLSQILSVWTGPADLSRFGWSLDVPMLRARIAALDDVRDITDFSVLHFVVDDQGSHVLADTAQRDARGPLGSIIRPSRPWALPLATPDHAISTAEHIQRITATQSGIGRLRVGDMLIVGQEGRP